MFAQTIFFTLALSLAHLQVSECQRDADRNAVDLLRYQTMPTVDGNYSFGYKTSNGISVEEKGFVKNPEAPKDQQINVKTGCYSYTTPEGAFVSVVYIADERGYRPKTRITYPQDTARHQQHLAEPCGLGPTSTSNFGSSSTTASPTKSPTPSRGRALNPDIFNHGSSTTAQSSSTTAPSTKPTNNKGLTSDNTTPKATNTNLLGSTTTTSSKVSSVSTTSTTAKPATGQNRNVRQPNNHDNSNCLCQSFVFELPDKSEVTVNYEDLNKETQLPKVTVHAYGSENSYELQVTALVID